MKFNGTVQWGQNDTVVVDSADGFNELLAEIESQAQSHPIMIDIITDDARSLVLGLGRDMSVLSIAGANGSLPYFASVGDVNARGEITFDYYGEETKFHMRNAVSIASARAAALQFLREPGLPSAVSWEKS
jgi:Immunity protein Imm1